LKEVLQLCVDAVGASGGTIYVHDPAIKRLRFQHVLPEDVADRLPVKDIPEDYGMAGQAFQSGETVMKDFPPKPQLSDFEQATGVVLRNMIACPLKMESETPFGVVQLLNKKDGSFNATDAAVLETVASVSAMAYVNTRLTEEATQASSLLGMGKVSHDIGNLAASLYANLSFSELAMGGLKEHLVGADVDDSVKLYVDTIDGMFVDIQKSVDRIVGYSRLISDLSAGRSLRPDKLLAPLADTIQTSAAYLETEGRKNHVALRYEIQEDAPPLYHDELYLFRIVQNLVGNAIKAVKETIPDDWQARLEGNNEDVILGEVIIRYLYREGRHIIEVQDTGPGMTPVVAERILKGTARSQWDKGGGSGWGTKIVLELAATHDAKVEIDSELGVGSTFRVVFPHCEGPKEN
ncbi:MAG: GAF domain-containing sensor histidine kinase, partial [Fimbriimonadaceae bacterium]|nr:GAF domain-containing sensor histidine kinase [Fimbriimonadaceae bacterium]